MKFMRADEEEFGHLIIDNFIEGISTDLSIEGLRGCRREAETLINTICDKEIELGNRKLVNHTPRCDALVWLKDLMRPSCPLNSE